MGRAGPRPLSRMSHPVAAVTFAQNGARSMGSRSMHHCGSPWPQHSGPTWPPPGHGRDPPYDSPDALAMAQACSPLNTAIKCYVSARLEPYTCWCSDGNFRHFFKTEGSISWQKRPSVARPTFPFAAKFSCGLQSAKPLCLVETLGACSFTSPLLDFVMWCVYRRCSCQK